MGYTNDPAEIQRKADSVEMILAELRGSLNYLQKHENATMELQGPLASVKKLLEDLLWDDLLNLKAPVDEISRHIRKYKAHEEGASYAMPDPKPSVVTASSPANVGVPQSPTTSQELESATDAATHTGSANRTPGVTGTPRPGSLFETPKSGTQPAGQQAARPPQIESTIHSNEKRPAMEATDQRRRLGRGPEIELPEVMRELEQRIKASGDANLLGWLDKLKSFCRGLVEDWSAFFGEGTRPADWSMTAISQLDTLLYSMPAEPPYSLHEPALASYRDAMDAIKSLQAQRTAELDKRGIQRIGGVRGVTGIQAGRLEADRTEAEYDPRPALRNTFYDIRPGMGGYEWKDGGRSVTLKKTLAILYTDIRSSG